MVCLLLNDCMRPSSTLFGETNISTETVTRDQINQDHFHERMSSSIMSNKTEKDGGK